MSRAHVAVRSVKVRGEMKVPLHLPGAR